MSRLVCVTPLPDLSDEVIPPIPEGLQGYELALTMAGAKVLAFQEFGSYQGRWWAYCERAGARFFITDYFGSCSGCDAFEGQFLYTADEREDYAYRLVQFGREYLENPLGQEEAEKEAARYAEESLEDENMLAWVKACPNKGV